MLLIALNRNKPNLIEVKDVLSKRCFYLVFTRIESAEESKTFQDIWTYLFFEPEKLIEGSRSIVKNDFRYRIQTPTGQMYFKIQTDSRGRYKKLALDAPDQFKIVASHAVDNVYQTTFEVF